MSSIKCGGHCCQGFFTQYSPREWRKYAKAVKNKTTWKMDDGKEFSAPNGKDIPMISEMLIIKHKYKKRLNRADLKTGLNYKYFYTCKHYDTETTLCTNYENRPRMCSDYPYEGKKCNYSQCGLNCDKHSQNK
jgi:Fe-S-cluster containining protein